MSTTEMMTNLANRLEHSERLATSSTDVEGEITAIEAMSAIFAAPTGSMMSIDSDDDDRRHDNTLRAKWAARALEQYLRYTQNSGDDPVEMAIRDLFGDLCHLADAFGVDMGRVVNDGIEGHNEEVRGYP